MKFKERIKTPRIVVSGILLISSAIQWIILQSYFYFQGFHLTFLESSIGISIIIFMNFLCFSMIHFFQSKIERKKFDILRREDDKRIQEIAYITTLDKLKNRIFRMNQTEKICEAINEFIIDVFQVNHSMVYLWSDEEGAFHPHPTLKNSNRFFVYDPFMLWLTDNDQIITKHDFEKFPIYADIKKDAIRILDSIDAETMIPLTLNASLLGVIFFGKKNNSNEMSVEEVDRLYEVRSASVMSLSNAIFYSRSIALTENLENKVRARTKALEETQAQLIMSEKMASLGVMVAGIAHEINTPAGVINGAADNMEANLHYLIRRFPEATKFFLDDEFSKNYIEIIEEILKDRTRYDLDPKERFKAKREIRNRITNQGVNASLADDISSFIVEQNFFEKEELFIKIVKIGGRQILDLIKHTSGINRNLRNTRYAIKNIVRIVRALKYYSHLDQASFADADLIEGIENTLIIFHNQLKLGIEIEKNFQEIPLVPCNLDELNQVWTNIVQNAIHAMKGKGVLKVSSYLEEPYVCIEIGDTGNGIKPEVLPKIWDPFFTTKDQGEGSGLGLGIVKGIIEKHKGKISVTSKPGETKFKIQLPYKG